MSLINVFVDDVDGRNVTCLSLDRATAVPIMDDLHDAGYRVMHDGWFTEAEEYAQRDAVRVYARLFNVFPPVAPTRRSVFADMRQAQFLASVARQQMTYTRTALSQYRTPAMCAADQESRDFLAESLVNARMEAMQWEHLAKWLAASVHPSGVQS